MVNVLGILLWREKALISTQVKTFNFSYFAKIRFRPFLQISQSVTPFSFLLDMVIHKTLTFGSTLPT